MGGPAEVLSLGQTAAWADGLAVTVSRPTEYVPADERTTPAPGVGDDVEPSAGSAAAAEEHGGAVAGDMPPAGTGVGAEGHAGGVGALPRTGADVGTAVDAGIAVAAETLAGTDVGAETRPDVERAPTSVRTQGPEPDPAVRTVLVIDVVVANGTAADVNPSIFVAVTSGGEDAEEYFDPGSGLTGPPGTMLPPGRDVRFSMAFSVQDPGDLTVEVRPAYHYEVALFTGGAG